MIIHPCIYLLHKIRCAVNLKFTFRHEFFCTVFGYHTQFEIADSSGQGVSIFVDTVKIMFDVIILQSIQQPSMYHTLELSYTYSQNAAILFNFMHNT
jgi:hypothetical protein